MKLIECYIAGFGTLKDATVSFDPGLTGFCQENGAGKSTLAAFLKAMLYGMASYKSNSKGFEDRRHYYPFDAGAFGGSLTLEYEGKTYCITRRFDAKSETKDAMTVTCDGAATDELGKIPGRTIFQVDEDSFARTAFITADPGELGATDGIAGRLQSFVDNTQGRADYAGAWEALDSAARQLQSVRGQSGKLQQQHARIRRLEQQLLERNQLETSLEVDYEDRQVLASQLEADSRLQEEARAQQLNWERWRSYQHLEQQALRREQQAQALAARCGSRLPEARERQTLEACRQSILRAATLEAHSTFPREKQGQLEALQAAYPKGIPSQQALAQAQALHSQLLAPEPPVEKPGALPVILLALGLALAAVGGALCFFRLWLGLALAAVALLTAAAGAVLLARGKKRCRQALAQRDRRRRQLEGELAAILAPYDLAEPTPRLAADGVRLQTLSAERQQTLQSQARYRQELIQARVQAGQILASLGIEAAQPPETVIEALAQAWDELPPLRAEAAQARAEADRYRRENALAQQPPEPALDARALADGMDRRRRQLANLDRQILDYEYRLEDLADTPVQLQEAREQLGDMERRYQLLTMARGCLEKAEQTLRQRHIQPVRSRFAHYADTLEAALGQRLELDKDFGLYLKEKGAQHPDKHLSAGQRALAALCLRLALLDNLYPDSKPPIILDDPFVFLDGEHLQKALALVRGLSADWQILYFTCHESRKI